MNFFEDDFGFGDSPTKSFKKPPQSRSNYPSQKSIINDDGFDDLLDGMLKQQNTRKQKSQNKGKTDNFGSAIKLSPPKNQLDRTDKFQPFDHFKSSKQLEDTNQFKLNRPSSRDSLKNKDNDHLNIFPGSFKPREQLNFQKKSETPQFSVGSMRNMRQPLRKRGQSKDNSVRDRSVKQPSIGSYQDFRDQQELPIVDFNNINRNNASVNLNLQKPPIQKRNSQTNLYSSQMPPLPNHKQTTQKQPEPAIIQKIYIKEQKSSQKQKQQFKKTLKAQLEKLKAQKQKQITFIQQKLSVEIQQRKKLMQQFSKQRQKDQELAQKLMKRQLENVKEMHTWQLNKKTDIYQMQIQQLKKINDLLQQQLKSTTKTTNSNTNHNQYNQQLKLKQRELQFNKKKLQNIESTLKMKQKSLQIREMDFDRYRMQQQHKIQTEWKKLHNFQQQLQKTKLQNRKAIEQQKAFLSTNLLQEQIDYQKKMDNLRKQRSQLDLQNQLFEKKKESFEEFNSNLLKQYKKKFKQLQEQKNNLQQIEIQIHKKLHTIELMGQHRLLTDSPKDKNQNKNIINKTGASHQSITQRRNVSLNKTENIKNRYKQLQQAIIQTPPKKLTDSKDPSNLKAYLLKMNRDNIRKRPF